MNKKFILGLAVVLVLAAGFFVYYNFIRVEEVDKIESLIPDQAVYLVYSYNPAGKVKEFINTPFAEKTRSLSFYQDEIHPNLKDIQEYFPLLEDIFQKEVFFVSFDMMDFSPGIDEIDLDNPDSNQLRFLLLEELLNSDWLIFTRISRDLNLKAIIAGYYLPALEQAGSSSRDYRGIRINTYHFPQADLALHWAVLGDVLVLASRKSQVMNSIDLLRDDTKESLLSKEFYQEALARVKPSKESLSWAYLSKRFYQELTSLFEDEPPLSFNKELYEFLNSGVGVLAYAPFKEGIVFDTYWLYDKDKVVSLEKKGSFVEAYLSKEGLGQELFSLVPADSLSTTALSGKMINALLELYKEIFSLMPELSEEAGFGRDEFNRQPFPEPEKAEAIISHIQENLAAYMDKGAVFSLVDIKEVAFSPPGAANFGMNLPIPLPLFSVVIDTIGAEEVRGQFYPLIEEAVLTFNEQVRAAMSLAQEVPLEEIAQQVIILSESYRGVDLKLIEFANFPLNQAYFFIDDYFVLTLSQRAAEAMIDTYYDYKDSISKVAEILAIEPGPLGDYSFISLTKCSRLIRRLDDTAIFSFFKGAAPMFSQGKITTAGINQFIDLLGDIGFIFYSYKAVEEDLTKTRLFVEIKGLN